MPLQVTGARHRAVARAVTGDPLVKNVDEPVRASWAVLNSESVQGYAIIRLTNAATGLGLSTSDLVPVPPGAPTLYGRAPTSLTVSWNTSGTPAGTYSIAVIVDELTADRRFVRNIGEDRFSVTLQAPAPVLPARRFEPGAWVTNNQGNNVDKFLIQSARWESVINPPAHWTYRLVYYSAPQSVAQGWFMPTTPPPSLRAVPKNAGTPLTGLSPHTIGSWVARASFPSVLIGSELSGNPNQPYNGIMVDALEWGDAFEHWLSSTAPPPWFSHAA